MMEPNDQFGWIKSNVDQIKQEISKVIVGQEQMVDLIIVAMLCDGHVLIEGNPGLAKTLTSKLLSRTLQCEFKRIQFTPDLMPSDVIGTSIYNMQNSNFEFRKGPLFSNIVLIDEINRAPAKTQAALFEAMEERQVTNDGVSHQLNPPFIVLATQNPIEMEGTYRLPEAQMDRFMFKIEVDYPTHDQELEILIRSKAKNNQTAIKEVSPVMTGAQIQEAQAQMKGITIEANLLNYIVQIVQKTRSHRDIEIGASPRASLAIMHAARALALMNNRDFVTPEDIIFVSYPVLTHRVTITAEKEMEGSSTKKILQALIKSVEIPR